MVAFAEDYVGESSCVDDFGHCCKSYHFQTRDLVHLELVHILILVTPASGGYLVACAASNIFVSRS